MISPLDSTIDMNWQYKVDTLLNLSLSANASSIKYALAYKDFDIYSNYEQDTTAKTFYPNKEWFKRKCENHLNQDKKTNRDTCTKDSLTVPDLIKILKYCLRNEGETLVFWHCQFGSMLVSWGHCVRIL
jgi:hypothetical protein